MSLYMFFFILFFSSYVSWVLHNIRIYERSHWKILFPKRSLLYEYIFCVNCIFNHISTVSWSTQILSTTTWTFQRKTILNFRWRLL